MGGASWRERAETEASLKRLLPTLDALLQQLDRVTMATEDLFHTECRLERAQRKRRERGRGRGGERGGQKGRSGERRGGEEMDSAGQRERKGGKEKDKGSKRGQKREKSGTSKDCGITVATPKQTHVAQPASFPKSRPSSASASLHTSTPAPHSAAKPPTAAPPPTPVSPLKSTPAPPFVPVTPTKTTPTHILTPKITPVPPPTPVPVHTPAPTPSLPSTPAPTPTTPAPLHGAREWDPPRERETLPPSSLFNHPAHTTTIPTRKRKRKPPPLKNKVHPNPDRHVSGHPKP